MIFWSLTFFAIAAISGFLGFTEIAGAASAIAVVQFGAFTFLGGLMLILPSLDPPNPSTQPMSETSERITTKGRGIYFDGDLLAEAMETGDDVPLLDVPLLDVDVQVMSEVNAALSAPPACGVLSEEDLEQLGCAVGWLERCEIDPAGKIAPAIQKLLRSIITKARSRQAESGEVVGVRREDAYKIGDTVWKSNGDGRMPCVVVSVFRKLSGTVRYVVEGDCEGCFGLLHIAGEGNLTPREAEAALASQLKEEHEPASE